MTMTVPARWRPVPPGAPHVVCPVCYVPVQIVDKQHHQAHHDWLSRITELAHELLDGSDAGAIPGREAALGDQLARVVLGVPAPDPPLPGGIDWPKIGRAVDQARRIAANETWDAAEPGSVDVRDLFPVIPAGPIQAEVAADVRELTRPAMCNDRACPVPGRHRAGAVYHPARGKPQECATRPGISAGIGRGGAGLTRAQWELEREREDSIYRDRQATT